MSKIGNFNIEITEKVNELGYDTVEEAIADGWDSNEFYASYMEKTRDERVEAHKAWLEEKKTVINGLKNAADYIDSLAEHSGLADAWKNDYYRQVKRINRAIDFIEKGEQ